MNNLDALSERWTRRAGLPNDPVPVASYRSPEIFKLKRERVFGRSWLVMGREEELAYGTVQTGSTIAAGQMADMAQLLESPAVSPTRATGWSMEVNFIVPHVNLDTGPGGFRAHHFWPLAVEMDGRPKVAHAPLPIPIRVPRESAPA